MLRIRQRKRSRAGVTSRPAVRYNLLRVSAEEGTLAKCEDEARAAGSRQARGRLAAADTKWDNDRQRPSFDLSRSRLARELSSFSSSVLCIYVCECGPLRCPRRRCAIHLHSPLPSLSLGLPSASARARKALRERCSAVRCAAAYVRQERGQLYDGLPPVSS